MVKGNEQDKEREKEERKKKKQTEKEKKEGEGKRETERERQRERGDDGLTSAPTSVLASTSRNSVGEGPQTLSAPAFPQLPLLIARRDAPLSPESAEGSGGEGHSG